MRKQHVFGALCAASLVAVIQAQTVTVTVRNPSGVEETEVLGPGENWMHTISSTTNRINIEPSANTVDIGRLTFEGGIGQDVDVILGSGTGLGLGANPTSVGNHWAGLDTSDGSAIFRLYGGITGDLTGSILVEQLDRFDADGVIQAQVQADDPYDVYFRVYADSVSSAGSINCVNGVLDEVNITHDCNGSITADGASGALDSIIINGGLFGDVSTSGTLNILNVDDDIGTTGTHVTIDALTINNIAADNIYADIVSDSSGALGRVRRIETRPGGDFDGSLSLREFQEISGTGDIGLYVLGDLSADVTFTKQLNSLGRINITGDLAAGATINIFRHLTGPIIIQNSAGLIGQIIVNSGDVGGAWTGNVTVGTTTLSPMGSYDETGLGGGAVGLVAFDCHLQDCDPPYSSASPPVSPILGGDPDNATPFEVTLTHYGPVTWTSGMPIKIMYCTGVVCDAPADVSSDFEVAHAAGSRDILITVKSGSTAEVGFYHITPIRTGDPALKCDETIANEPLVVDYTYDVEYLG